MVQLKRLRTEKGLSQAKLAARADIDPSTVNQIERGAREASPATLRKLSQALDVSIAELLEDTAPKVQAPLPLDDSGPRTVEELLERAGVRARWLLLPDEEFDQWWLDISREEASHRFWEIWAEYEVIRDEWRAVNQGTSTAAPELQAEMFGVWYEAFTRAVLGASFTAPQKGESEEEFEARQREGAAVFMTRGDVERAERDPHQLVAGGTA